MRFALDTASTRSFPALTFGNGPEIAMQPSGGSRASTAATAGPAPRK